MALTGGCQCGAVRYELSIEPLAVYICHCRECQKQSASAFGISVRVAKSAFRLQQGDVKSWTRRADSGRTVDCLFCVACGSRVWHAVAGKEVISVKGGSLDQPLVLTSAVHIWTSRKLPGVVIPDGAVRFAKGPDEPECPSPFGVPGAATHI